MFHLFKTLCMEFGIVNSCSPKHQEQKKLQRAWGRGKSVSYFLKTGPYGNCRHQDQPVQNWHKSKFQTFDLFEYLAQRERCAVYYLKRPSHGKLKLENSSRCV